MQSISYKWPNKFTMGNYDDENITESYPTILTMTIPAINVSKINPIFTEMYGESSHFCSFFKYFVWLHNEAKNFEKKIENKMIDASKMNGISCSELYIEILLEENMTNVTGYRIWLFFNDFDFDISKKTKTLIESCGPIKKDMEMQENSKTQNGPKKSKKMKTNSNETIETKKLKLMANEFGDYESYADLVRKLNGYKELYSSKQVYELSSLDGNDNEIDPKNVFSPKISFDSRSLNEMGVMCKIYVEQMSFLNYFKRKEKPRNQFSSFPFPKLVFQVHNSIDIDNLYKLFTPDIYLEKYEIETWLVNERITDEFDNCEMDCDLSYEDKINKIKQIPIETMEQSKKIQRLMSKKNIFSNFPQSDILLELQIVNAASNNSVTNQQSFIDTKRFQLQLFLKILTKSRNNCTSTIKEMVDIIEFQSPNSWNITSRKQKCSNLSIFGNFVACEVEAFRTIRRVESPKHHILFKLMGCVMTCTAADPSQRLNVLFVGDSSTGKSFLLKQIQNNCLDKSIKLGTYESEKAGTTGEHEFDIIQLKHETPETDIGRDRKGFEVHATASQKTDLTESFNTSRRPKKDKDGNIIGTITLITGNRKSSVSNVNIEPPSESSNLYTRYVTITMPPAGEHETSENFSVGIDVVENLSKQGELNCLFWKNLHTLYMFVDKSIFIGLIEDVNLTIPNFMFDELLRKLTTQRKELLRAQSTRSKTAFLSYCRSLTIQYIVYKRFFHNESREILYPNMNLNDLVGSLLNYNEDHIIFDISKDLVCTEEISFFALTLWEDQIVNQCTVDLLKTIIELSDTNLFCDLKISKSPRQTEYETDPESKELTVNGHGKKGRDALVRYLSKYESKETKTKRLAKYPNMIILSSLTNLCEKSTVVETYEENEESSERIGQLFESMISCGNSIENQKYRLVIHNTILEKFKSENFLMENFFLKTLKNVVADKFSEKNFICASFYKSPNTMESTPHFSIFNIPQNDADKFVRNNISLTKEMQKLTDFYPDVEEISDIYKLDSPLDEIVSKLHLIKCYSNDENEEISTPQKFNEIIFRNVDFSELINYPHQLEESEFQSKSNPISTDMTQLLTHKRKKNF